MKVTMNEAQHSLCELGRRVWQGERVVITKTGEPYLELVSHKARLTPRKPGRFKGQIELGGDFNEDFNWD
ncbi:type II toxin-antitoxin system Phd/YefM family antitoxin [Pseudovibrio sp. Alg231-02]|uniref:type II toxin-antitoxin system Phd/YefM family antitoxin n=1 Tax=Pseudovibrio sp. Alg231-02 TaxID=1922223 RepID=UPI000D54DD65|nr:type II toxin-antitoxin system prevent-host-death family antitoxin [Pseudovibrio sp. Alg231-02]